MELNSLHVQYMSDIHLEFYKAKNVPYVKAVAPYLVLSGDIGYPLFDHYKLFLEDCSMKFKMVFVLTGNHEYYQGKNPKTIDQIELRVMEICAKLKNVYYLQNSFVALDNQENFIHYGENPDILNSEFINSVPKYIIAGTTLWSQIPDKIHDIAQSTMLDYTKIYKEPETCISISDTNQMHVESVNWITNLTKIIANLKVPIKPSILMVTHHAPSFKMISKIHINDPLIYAFAADLEALMGFIQVWISGHTHNSVDIVINNTLCTSNCKGYKNESIKFIADKTIRLN